MQRWQSAIKKVLILLSALLVVRLIWVWYPVVDAGHGVDTEVRSEERAAGSEGMDGLEGDAKEEFSRASYEVISKNNVFNPWRTERWTVQRAVVKTQHKVAPRPKPVKKSLTLVLEGVIIVDDYYAAFVRDRANAMAGSRRVMVGETIDSYNVKSITGDELVLTGEDGSIEVLNLYDSGQKVNRRNVRTAVTPTQLQQARPGPSRTTPVRRPLPLQRRTTTTR